MCAASLALFSVPAYASPDNGGSGNTGSDDAGQRSSSAFAQDEVSASGQDETSASAQDETSVKADTAASTRTRIPTVWVIGDSTAAEFNDTTYYYPRYGWGTQLYRYFPGLSIQIWQYQAPAPRAICRQTTTSASFGKCRREIMC